MPFPARHPGGSRPSTNRTTAATKPASSRPKVGASPYRRPAIAARQHPQQLSRPEAERVIIQTVPGLGRRSPWAAANASSGSPKRRHQADPPCPDPAPSGHWSEELDTISNRPPLIRNSRFVDCPTSAPARSSEAPPGPMRARRRARAGSGRLTRWNTASFGIDFNGVRERS